MNHNKMTSASAGSVEDIVAQKCHFGAVEGGTFCTKPGTEMLCASWSYYPHGDWDVPLCAEHKRAILNMECDRWLHDVAHERRERSDNRSRHCGEPAIGLICWDCEGNHDHECEEISCPGYSFTPACAGCLANPNDNDIDREQRAKPDTISLNAR